jgi:deoxycytidylate deaminase
MVTSIDSSSMRAELVIAVVCPLGARIDALEDSIAKALARFNYTTQHIRLSDLLRNLSSWTDEKDATEETRLRNRQRHAANFRDIGGLDALSRAAIAEIRKRRARISGFPDRAANGVAYILRQIKRPEEIQCLRRIYGPSLLVIAGHAPEEIRIQSLADLLARTAGRASPLGFENKARALINTDQSDDNPTDDKARFRENTRDAYPLADFFVDLSAGDGSSVSRILDLFFGHPFHTPTAEEMAMHQASAMALRSSDERRQVGAVIVKRTPRGLVMDKFAEATVVASGTNEVPRRQGGYYWDSESPDRRDQSLRQLNQGFDREERIKLDALREIAERLKTNKWLARELVNLEETELVNRLLKVLDRTQFSSISEFMRQVHAEMAAIVDAAMRGVPVRECEMYVTTFPCHGCAKHIIAAGIKKVVFLEPYPKSKAELLHKEEIALDPPNPSPDDDRVLFVPFTGVAPRQFARVFSMSTRGRKNGYSLEDWQKNQATLKPQFVIARADFAYTRAERDALELLPNQFMWDKETVTPTISPI